MACPAPTGTVAGVKDRLVRGGMESRRCRDYGIGYGRLGGVGLGRRRMSLSRWIQPPALERCSESGRRCDARPSAPHGMARDSETRFWCIGRGLGMELGWDARNASFRERGPSAAL